MTLGYFLVHILHVRGLCGLLVKGKDSWPVGRYWLLLQVVGSSPPHGYGACALEQFTLLLIASPRP